METTTVGELRQALKNYPDNWQVIFGCEELEFYRVKRRGEGLVQIEFNQVIYSSNEKIIATSI
jgi:predicted secreted protein